MSFKIDNDLVVKLFDTLLAMHSVDKSSYLSIEEIGSIVGLDQTLSSDEKKIRAYIFKTRKRLRINGYIVANKRNKGWKIAHGYEAMDEREKACNRALKGIIGIQGSHFNKFLTFDDVLQDKIRIKQNNVIKEFTSKLNSMIDELSKILSESPTKDIARTEVRNSDYLGD